MVVSSVVVMKVTDDDCISVEEIVKPVTTVPSVELAPCVVVSSVTSVVVTSLVVVSSVENVAAVKGVLSVLVNS